MDLLFYNLKLRCYVVIELKTGDFKPEYAGKLNFYLTAVDNILKTEQDAPTIGLLLCKSKNDLITEYALQDINKPIGVSEYRITDEILEKFRQQLPSIEDIKNRIEYLLTHTRRILDRYAAYFFLSIFAGFVIEYKLAPFWAVCPLGANISTRKGTINGKRTFAS